MHQERIKGLMMVIIAASMWGISGTIAQYLFQYNNVSPGWLVSIRLLFSGAVLLIFNNKKHVFLVWKMKKDRLNIFIFAILGMMLVQYSYFRSIQLGNAATATFLQYLAPVYIVVFVAAKGTKKPSLIEIISISLAIMGLFFLVTNGSIHQLTVSSSSVFWGIISGIALAFYTLFPVNLLRTWGTAITVGWGMLIGGIVLSVIYPPWQVQHINWDIISIFGILFICTFGTLIAFYLYLSSLYYILPTEASILSSAEPLTATLTTVVFLHVPFTNIEILGGILILLNVILLSRKKRAG